MVLSIALIYIHMPFNYKLVPSPRSCVIATSSYQTFYSMWNLFFFAWIPTLCMLIFGLLTIRNVHQGKKRIAATTTAPNRENDGHSHQKNIDRQLIRMLIVQCLVFGSLSTINSIFQLYVSITNGIMAKTEFEKTRDNSILSASNGSTIFGPCLSFYLFASASPLFRSELMNLFCRRSIQELSHTTATAKHGTRSLAK